MALLHIVTIVLVILKLIPVSAVFAGASWWLILLPSIVAFAPLALVFVTLVFGLAAGLIVSLVQHFSNRK